MVPPAQLPPPDWLERRTQHSFRYRKRSRTVSDTAEEAYLRLDIPCGSPDCVACPPTSPALAPSPQHLLLPDASVLAGCLEVFELPEVENLVLLTSVVRQLHDGGNMRRAARLRALYSDPRRRNVLFDNLHHRETAPASLREQRAGLALLAAAEWYYEHLGSRLPVVVVSDSLAQQFGGDSGRGGGSLSGLAAHDQQPPPQQQVATAAPQLGRAREDEDEDPELDALLRQMHVGAPAASGGAGDNIASLLDSLGIGGDEPGGAEAAPLCQLSGQPEQLPPPEQTPGAAAASKAPLLLDPGVHILSAADYFGGCWGHVPAVVDVFESIQQQSKAGEAASSGAGGGGAFRPHLSAAAMEAGLAAGALLAGTLSASRRVRGEASVAVGGGRVLVVAGWAAMNRAVHGDRVAVRLLPREQWHTIGAAGPGGSGAGGGADGDGGGAEEEEVEEEEEHDLLAAAGAGEADVAADEAHGGGDELADPLDALLAGGAAGAGSGAGGLQPTAEVVGILQRWSGEVAACISEDDERALAARQDSGRQEAVLCIPTDRRLPKIRLRSRQLHRLLGQRLVLRLDGWDQGSRYPHGHLVRSLGPINFLRSETDGVLVSSGVHWQPFSEGALRELPPIAGGAEYVMPPGEVAARRDMRGAEYLTCSIDPPGCTDVDDALSVRWLEPGGGGPRLAEVGVHIADVSFFVRQGGLLDGEAAARCTTVYLVDRRLDMLPALLSEDLCSLRSGQDRYAVSVVWTLDADSLEVRDVWFGRTLIRSRYQLEYSQAQAIMEGRPQPLQPASQHGGGGTGEQAVPAADLPPLQRNLRLLAALAEHRRQMRLQDGAVELESAELRFKTDPAGQPTGVTVKQEIPMMRIVAEMMILANAAVGRRVHNAFPRAALLRRHPPPRREALAEVAALCESVGQPLDFEGGAAALSASLAAAAAAAPSAVSSLIKSLATRAMSEAEYFCTGDVTGRGGGGMSHFGLALPFYTHFTSPIRRYADVVVHRQLLAAVAAAAASSSPAPLPQAQVAARPSPAQLPALLAAAPPPLPGPEVAERAAVMNERHRTAKRAQKECSDLYLLLLLHAQPHVEAATIYGLRPQALLVFLPKYHLKGVIHLTDKAGVCKPPLRQPGEEQLEEPFVLAYRRGLALVAEGGGGGEDAALRQLSVVEAASGRQVAAYRPMQRLWVQLSADGSRAHGPRLRMRLLADEHPAAVQAAEREAAEAAAAGRGQGGGGVDAPGCGSLPRRGAARPAYRPPGVGTAAAASEAVGRPGAPAAARGPPPGFEPVSAQAGPSEGASSGDLAGPSAAASSSSTAPTEPQSLAAQLHAFLEQQGLEAGQAGPLAWEVTLPPLDQLPSSCSSSMGDSAHRSAHAALRRAMRQLETRAARLQLRAGVGAPGRPRTEQCSAAAAAVRQQILALQQHLVPG